jgi:hypothetical protein
MKGSPGKETYHHFWNLPLGLSLLLSSLFKWKTTAPKEKTT